MTGVEEFAAALVKNVERVVYGKRAVIERIVVALLCNGHVLLEDVPGVGKTILARALSASLGGNSAASSARLTCFPRTSWACPSTTPAAPVSSCAKGPS